MSPTISDLQRQLLGTFLEESHEGLARLEEGLLGLDASGPDAVVVNDIFRAAHSLKGAAGTFGFPSITALAHEMETVLDGVRSGRRAVTPPLTALLLRGVDALRNLFEDIGRGGTADGEPFKPVLEALKTAVREVTPQSAAPVGPPPQAAPAAAAFRIHFRPHAGLLAGGNEPLRLFRELAELGSLAVTADMSGVPDLASLAPEVCHLAWTLELRGSVSRAQILEVFSWVEDECDLRVEPLEAERPRPPESAAAPLPVAAGPPGPERGGTTSDDQLNSIRVSINKVDQLMNMVGELVITQSMLGELDDEGPIDPGRMARIREGLSQLARNTRALQDSVMRLRSLPVSILFARFPRLVHDTSRALEKKVELKLSGQSTEVDKTVLEKLSDPLVHLVRNALDHGLEGPAERMTAGKPAAGVIELKAYHRGGDIIIEVQDDGRGLSRDRILAKARKLGMIGEDVEPDDNAVFELIFAPGFSTASTITDLSGRGVGMDVVRKNIRALGGDVSVSSRPGEGTRVALRVPLTLAIIDGQLVRMGEYSYVVPLLSIVESIQLDPKTFSKVEGRLPVYRLRDQIVPVVDLARLLRVPTTVNDPLEKLMVVVESDGELVGLLVEELLAQQQVVVKSLETNFERVEGLSGATVLGDGRIAFILDVVGIGRMARAKAARSEKIAA